jgi:alginate O-acetyltransferase complex protein AlgI
MLFYSQTYLLFFLGVFFVYWSLPWHRARVWLLVIASFAFYASWSGTLALLVTGTTVVDYLLARGIDAGGSARRRKALLGLSLAMNLGVLCYFKYANFFLDSLRATLRAAGLDASLPLLEVVIPFGISFYTFEAISYMVDVYRGKVRAERNLGNLLLFILFFPHLVAGPIVRGRDFLPQVNRPKRFSWLRAKYGIELFLVGLFKKLAVGDPLAQYSDILFDPAVDLSRYEPWAVWLAVLAFAIRIYCDFSGYSDMALGSAHLLGYKLTVNFRLPYLAANIGEFWRRWHISLSNWIRDYLFIPLGGSRGSGWKTARNLLIAMTLCGLWHGAGWSYVLFGAVHGLLLIGQRSFHLFAEARPRLRGALSSRVGTAGRVALTFTVVAAGWVLFQPSLERAAHVYRALLPRVNVPNPQAVLNLTRTCWLAGLFLLGQLAAVAGLLKLYSRRQPGVVQGVGYALMLAGACLLAPPSPRVFVYFQF